MSLSDILCVSEQSWSKAGRVLEPAVVSLRRVGESEAEKMKAERKSRTVMRTASLLIAVCLGGVPAWGNYGGGTGEPNGPYLIYTAQHVYDMGTTAEHLSRHFRLMADIDMGKSDRTNFYPIGLSLDRPFTGTFDGNGHIISNVTYILSGAIQDNIGLFGYLGDPFHRPTIKNLGLIDPNIDALTEGTGGNVGSLVGCLFNGTVVNCYVQGGRVLGYRCVGGLIGGPAPTRNAVARRIESCHAGTRVSGISEVGGLMGGNDRTMVFCCYATGNVSGYNRVGGLVGYNLGWLFGCYFSGRVLAVNYAGGLAGLNDAGGEIFRCYCDARVLGDSYVGGLAGANDGLVKQCYSQGSIEGVMNTGGLVGSLHAGVSDRYGTVTDSFWDVQTSGQSTSAGGTGKTTAELQTAKTFLDAGWDFVDETTHGTEDVWWIDEGKDYPRLRWETAADPNSSTAGTNP